MKRAISLAIVSTFALAACGSESDSAADSAEVVEAPAPQRSATADLADVDGNPVGSVTVTESDGMLLVSLNAENMPEGVHGAHIHTTGDCSAPDFTSAGGHWNPGDTNHGTESEAPNPHAGDLPNLEIFGSGTGILEAASMGTFDGLMDSDGAAFVIHADPDDYKSQPSGNAGERIACGVFAAN